MRSASRRATRCGRTPTCCRRRRHRRPERARRPAHRRRHRRGHGRRRVRPGTRAAAARRDARGARAKTARRRRAEPSSVGAVSIRPAPRPRGRLPVEGFRGGRRRFGHALDMAPRIDPALPLVWRSPAELQLGGLTPRVVMRDPGGLETGLVAALRHGASTLDAPHHRRGARRFARRGRSGARAARAGLRPGDGCPAPRIRPHRPVASSSMPTARSPACCSRTSPRSATDAVRLDDVDGGDAAGRDVALAVIAAPG